MHTTPVASRCARCADAASPPAPLLSLSRSRRYAEVRALLGERYDGMIASAAGGTERADVSHLLVGLGDAPEEVVVDVVGATGRG